MLYAAPGTPGAKVAFKPQYENFINGKFVPPLKGQYFDVITPISGAFTSGPKSAETKSAPTTPHAGRSASSTQIGSVHATSAPDSSRVAAVTPAPSPACAGAAPAWAPAATR